MNEDQVRCAVCNYPVTSHLPHFKTGRDSLYYECPNCGMYEISHSAYVCLESADERARAVLSTWIWNNQDNESFCVSTLHLEEAKKAELPDPAEQLNRLILYLGRNQQTAGISLRIQHGSLRAKIGAQKSEDEHFFVREAQDAGLILKENDSNKYFYIRLTLRGWQYFHELKRGEVISRTAFMAMTFHDEVVTAIVRNTFCPAVQETGFTLRRVDDNPRAGLIDDKIRVDIRLSRFLVADLTYDNRGAYWEAGYAEGLGKPVIYTCNGLWFAEQNTHFDTNHHHTILWDPERPEEAAEKLKATIRATLPTEARMDSQ